MITIPLYNAPFSNNPIGQITITEEAHRELIETAWKLKKGPRLKLGVLGDAASGPRQTIRAEIAWPD